MTTCREVLGEIVLAVVVNLVLWTVVGLMSVGAVTLYLGWVGRS